MPVSRVEMKNVYRLLYEVLNIFEDTLIAERARGDSQMLKDAHSRWQVVMAEVSKLRDAE